MHKTGTIHAAKLASSERLQRGIYQYQLQEAA